ncbi:methenyltetrahydrofolate cyclohydrolase [Aureococcus anophagefferens]|nr:methenyltetrahydrofolate cyclohydrolase [Aureococcus anophagefferens]
MRWRPTVIAAAALGGRALLTAAMAAVQGVNILDGAATAKAIRAELGRDVDALRAARRHAGLGVVLVGERRDSQTYVRMKQKVAAEIGVHCVDALLPDTASEAEILAAEAMNADPDAHGILVQLPLPAHVDEGRVLGAIDFRKDADGFSETNVARLVMQGGPPPLAMPCTPAGCCVEFKSSTRLQCLRRDGDRVPLGDARRRAIVRDADVVVAAVGRALRRGVVAAGLRRRRRRHARDDPEAKRGYRLVGDVDFEAAKDVASLITPVPGGVGPMTIAMLMSNGT